MPLSIYLARLFGFFFIFAGLMWITKRQKMKKIARSLFDDPALMTFMAVLNVLIGLALVLAHNVWVKHWPTLVTVMCYLILIRGLVRTFFPDYWRQAGENITEGQKPFYVGSVVVLIGLIYLFFGYSY